MTSADPRLAEQIAYYRARAGEYDEWFLRQGRYDHGEALNAQWFSEVGALDAALDRFAPAGRVLELACGTGWWTQRLSTRASQLTAVDSSPEVLALNHTRVGRDNVRYVQANLFAWQPEERYDIVFFSFWLSHVPPQRFTAFWEFVRGCLAPGGRVFFIDSAYDATSTAKDHTLDGPDAATINRRLNDGDQYRIVKVFYRPDTLARQLAEIGWSAEVHATERYFIFGSAQPHAPTR